uniref:Uncharacterized protein n=1 Tax=Globodera rostochiensis TaxID=31243 RepID=A0A914H968_GLORO
MSLRNNMTGAERTTDNPLYDTFIAETPFIATISNLRKRCRTLRAQQRTLEQLLPRDSPNANPAATPNSGPLVGVNDLPNLPDAIKLTYLKQCLTGPPLSLISSLLVTDPSYVTALDLLRENYGNPEDVARALHNSLRQLPVVRRGDNFCTDLRSLVDHIESICVQMTQQNHDCNTVAFQMEMEEHCPEPFQWTFFPLLALTLAMSIVNHSEHGAITPAVRAPSPIRVVSGEPSNPNDVDAVSIISVQSNTTTHHERTNQREDAQGRGGGRSIPTAAAPERLPMIDAAVTL